MNFMFPKTKFADENTLEEQLKHLESELEEVKKAGTYYDMTEELFDLIHSAETALRIIRKDPDLNKAMDFIKEEVIMKNIERGYYTGVCENECKT